MKQEKKMLQEFPEIIGVLMQKAKDGDMTAMKLYLERVMAAKRVAEENEERGGQTINVFVQGAKASKIMGKTIEAEFEELEEEEEDGSSELE
jgi:hypothetical protein